jgi:hypothetical protein
MIGTSLIGFLKQSRLRDCQTGHVHGFMPFVAVATKDRHDIHLKLEDLHTSWTFIEIDGVPGNELQRIS